MTTIRPTKDQLQKIEYSIVCLEERKDTEKVKREIQDLKELMELSWVHYPSFLDAAVHNSGVLNNYMF